jgi:translocation and assembly module TamA
LIALTCFTALQASAVELFGVTILGDKKPAGAISYSVTIEVAGGDEALKEALSAASILVAQEKGGASDSFALAARARGDIERLVAALYAEAYYGADIKVRVGDVPLDEVRPDDIDVVAGVPVAVAVHVDPGPLFRFGGLAIESGAAREADPSSDPADYGLVPGQPAKSSLIIAAGDQLVERWRAAGYPFAQLAKKEVSADHARSAVDVRFVIAPGDAAVYGWVNVTGSVDLDSRLIADQAALEPGHRFSPRDLKTTRERLRKFESIESVRVIEGEAPDETGGIPITIEVVERKARYFGATVSASTVDGVELQTYWGHRNLFGGGEQLRVDGTISQIGVEGLSHLQFDVGATFTKPAIYDINTDLFSEFRIVRERPETYQSLSGNARIGVAHRFDPFLSGSLAAEAAQSRIDDAFGTTNYTLLSLPGELLYDSRDDRLDPSAGTSAVLRLSPVVEASSGATFGASEIWLARYLSLDEDDRAVLAGRVMIGSDFGASLSEVPATYRFFAGGGGSVRGYEYRSLGPIYDGEVVGGLSMLGGSAEFRWRVFDTVGLVPFIDAALVSPDSFPDFSEPVYIGAGLGLRYYTSFGPLRLDLAMPLTHTEGQPKFGAYVGLGQAF